ncbi:MAG: GTP 3',8-cyclase MoaA [Planctomycetota bacterium]
MHANEQEQRDALSLRVSITDRCQLRCRYCMPAQGVEARRREEVLSYEEIARFVRVLTGEFPLGKVRVTGGEPLVRRDATKLVAMLGAMGIPDLAMTTNGLRLAEAADGLAAAGLDRVNVSLDSVDRRTYGQLTRGGRLGDAVEGIRCAVASGLTPVKTNTVVLRGVNDEEVVEIARSALRMGCTPRFLELMPIGCAAPDDLELFVPADEILDRLRESFALRPLSHSPGRTSRDFSADDGRGVRGTVGLIAPRTRPFCRGCGRLRLTATGDVIGCLARGEGPNVRGLLRKKTPAADQKLIDTLRELVRGKSGRRGFPTGRPMSAVGG